MPRTINFSCKENMRLALMGKGDGKSYKTFPMYFDRITKIPLPLVLKSISHNELTRKATHYEA